MQGPVTNFHFVLLVVYVTFNENCQTESNRMPDNMANFNNEVILVYIFCLHD